MASEKHQEELNLRFVTCCVTCVTKKRSIMISGCQKCRSNSARTWFSHSSLPFPEDFALDEDQKPTTLRDLEIDFLKEQLNDFSVEGDYCFFFFNIFINDLPRATDFTTLSTYADDTQIFYAEDNVTDVEQAINSDLRKIDKWYEENEMGRNHEKYQAMIMGKTSRDPAFKCEGTSIPLVEEVELLGVTVDNKLKFGSQIKKICRKVSQQMAVLRRMKKLLPLKLRENIYIAFIAPHFNYCAESWHFCSNRSTKKFEKMDIAS